MKRIAGPTLFFFGAVFACGADQRGFDENRMPVFGSDAGADVGVATSCEGRFRCSRDLRSIVDACDESRVITTCPPDQGCGDGKCLPACDPAVAANATMGCEFVPLAPPRVLPQFGAGSCFAALLTNSWVTSARIEAEYDGHPLDIGQIARVVRTNGAQTTYEPFTGEMQPGDVMALFLSQSPTGTGDSFVPCPKGVTPAVPRDTDLTATSRGPTFHIKTTAPISAYTLYPFGGIVSTASNAALLLPIPSWKNEHIVTTPRDAFYWASPYPGDEGTLFRPTTDIVAAEDDTEVTVVPSVNIAGGQDVDGVAKGVAHTYRMRKGELIHFTQDQDLTGTRISSNKPVGVWGGHECMNMPTSYGTCDTSQTMLFPVPAWGREYVLAPYISRMSGEAPEDYLYRVTGAVDGTVLTYEPGRPKGAPASLSAGESVLFSSREPFVVKSQDADHPFAAFAYMTGFSYVNAVAFDGDPEFLPIVPTEQYLSKYAFFLDPRVLNSQLVVVRSRDDGKDFEPVVLECVGTLDGWSPIGTSGKHEFTRVRLTRQGKPQTFGANTCAGGRFTIESKGPIAVNVWGTGQFASYAYPGGAALRTLNRVETIVK